MIGTDNVCFPGQRRLSNMHVLPSDKRCGRDVFRGSHAEKGGEENRDALSGEMDTEALVFGRLGADINALSLIRE